MTLQLRAYQREVVADLVRILDEKQVAWNLSEQRTGKLIELIALTKRLEGDGLPGGLIVAPLSTLLNVRDEFERWHAMPVYVNPPEPNTATYYGMVAINPEKLRDPNHWVFTQDWGLVVLDECHRFRGRKSQQTKGAMNLASRAERLVLMTGTPLMNGLPRELWPLLYMTEAQTPRRERKFNSFWRFMEQHAVNQPGFGWYQTQDERAPWTKEGKKKIQDWLAPLVVRRTFAEVRPELPALVEQVIKLDLEALDPTHLADYRRLEEEWRYTIGDEDVDVPTKLAVTTRLRQLAASPANLGAEWVGGKVKAIVEWAADQTGKGVVWCWHRAMADALADALAGTEKVAPHVVHGGVDPMRRKWYCDGFQSGEGSRILVATIGSLKEGITLDTASWACFAEQSWLPADNEQAAMRIVGPNQAGSPLVTTFINERTIEETIEKVLARKGGAITSFMDVFQEVMRAAH